MEKRLVTYFPDWWTFPLWNAFRGWYAVVDPIPKKGLAERCATGITREYMYHTFVQAPDPALAENMQNDFHGFHIYLAESAAPSSP
jgi:hypothetical protein